MIRITLEARPRATAGWDFDAGAAAEELRRAIPTSRKRQEPATVSQAGEPQGASNRVRRSGLEHARPATRSAVRSGCERSTATGPTRGGAGLAARGQTTMWRRATPTAGGSSGMHLPGFPNGIGVVQQAPQRITRLTCRVLRISVSGFASGRPESATLPAASVPIESARQEPGAVDRRGAKASLAVSPAFTSSAHLGMQRRSRRQHLVEASVPPPAITPPATRNPARRDPAWVVTRGSAA